MKDVVVIVVNIGGGCSNPTGTQYYKCEKCDYKYGGEKYDYKYGGEKCGNSIIINKKTGYNYKGK
jgi:hypothetical protein